MPKKEKKQFYQLEQSHIDYLKHNIFQNDKRIHINIPLPPRKSERNREKLIQNENIPIPTPTPKTRQQPTILPLQQSNKKKKETADDLITRIGDVAALFESPLNAITGTNILNSKLATNTAYRLNNPTKANIIEMQPTAKLNAELVNLSEIYHKSNLDIIKANAELNKINARYDTDYKIDQHLSNHEAVVVFDELKNSIISYRGTDINNAIKSGLGKGLKEPTIWTGVLTGKEQNFDYFKTTEKTVLKAQEKGYNILNLNGYSLGGTAALQLGNKYTIPTYTINPFIGTTLLNNETNNKNVTHNVTRTTNDFATTLWILNKPDSNYYIDNIDPIKKVISVPSAESNKINPKTEFIELLNLRNAHGIDNFIVDANRANLQDELNKSLQLAGEKLGDAQMRSSAIDALDNNLSYTEWLTQTGNTGDIINNELDPTRTGKGKNYYEIWLQESQNLNKTAFNQNEINILQNAPMTGTPYQTVLSNEEIKTIRKTGNPDERVAIVNKYQNKAFEISDIVIRPVAYQNNMANTAAKAINVAQGAGTFLGSVVGSAATGLLFGDSLNEVGPVGESVIQGAVGGAATEVLISRLVTQTFAPAIMNIATSAGSGGIAAGVQVLTSLAASNILNAVGLTGDANEITSQIIGGGTGGYSAVIATPIVTEALGATAEFFGLASVAEEAAISSVGGPLAVAITVAVSAAIAGGFAIYKAVQPKNDFVLLPFLQKQADNAIGSDTHVLAILTDFNQRGLYSEADQAIAIQAIEARAKVLQDTGVIKQDYNFQARLTPVPRDYMANNLKNAYDYRQSSAMIPAEYPKNFINTGVRSPAEEEQHKITTAETENQRQIYLDNLDTVEAEKFKKISEQIDTSKLNIAQIDKIIIPPTEQVPDFVNKRVINDLKRDPEFIKLTQQGDIAAANKRIVTYFEERQTGAHLYKDAYFYNDPIIPQIEEGNKIAYKSLDQIII